MTDRTTDDAVRDQYETWPYPARDPKDEATRLIAGSPSHLLEIDHYVFAGRRDPSAPFHALVAGGGTGDATVMLAQHLADHAAREGGTSDWSVTYLDLSDASRTIAEARIAARGLSGNVRFVQGEIEAVGEIAPGAFDYIDCCGVLHHLADPAAGLRALAGQLRPGGGMGLMVYGTLGRTGVYHLQDAMGVMADEAPDGERLRLMKRLLKDLPRTNWLKRNPFVGDHFQGGDAGIFDLLLHRRDRSYRIGEVFELLAAAGLAPVATIEPARYDPATYLSDPALLKAARARPPAEQAALAELLSGAMTKHIVYAASAAEGERRPAAISGLGDILAFRDLDPAAVTQGLQPGGKLAVEIGGVPFTAPLPPLRARHRKAAGWPPHPRPGVGGDPHRRRCEDRRDRVPRADPHFDGRLRPHQPAADPAGGRGRRRCHYSPGARPARPEPPPEVRDLMASRAVPRMPFGMKMMNRTSRMP